MNEKFLNAVKVTKRFLGKHSPEILTGIGLVGMGTSVVLAVKATPKALELIDQERESRKVKETLYADNQPYVTYVKPELTAFETVKTAWKPYVPAAVSFALSASCIIGASAVNAKRNAAIATAYALTERTLVHYRDKVVETLGEKKEREIRQQINQDEINNKPISNSQVIITPKGNTLFMDAISGRYFKSDLDHIRKAINELNRDMTRHNYVSLSEFYNKIGLDHTKNSDRLGWNLDDELVDVNYDTCLAEDEPCIVIDFVVPPKYDFDMFG